LELALKLQPQHPARRFLVGAHGDVVMADCGRLTLDADEQVTLTTEAGAEYDVARKDWGFYATPSLNGRLESFGLRGVLVKNAIGRYFVLLVEGGKEDLFEAYRASEGLAIVTWLDSTGALDLLEQALREHP